MSSILKKNAGISYDGMQITNPVLFLESILEKIPGISDILDGAPNPPTLQATSKNSSFTGMLSQDPKLNSKQFQTLDSFGLARISASGFNNSCFFDSFLTCMSPRYRNLELKKRQAVFVAFRNWCAMNSAEIVKHTPEFLTRVESIKDLSDDLNDLTKEILDKTGFVIAWFFGVNCVFIRKPAETNIGMRYKWQVSCDLAYQSPDCKTIVMTNTGNHYEPVCKLQLDADSKIDESASKFVFGWKDSDLCKLKTICNEICKPTKLFPELGNWQYPVCSAQAGGKRTRKVRIRKARKINKKSKTRRYKK